MIDSIENTLMAKSGHHMMEGAKKIYAAQWASLDDVDYLVTLAEVHLKQAVEYLGELRDKLNERHIVAEISHEG